VPATRLVLPQTRFFECRTDGGAQICDPGSALWLAPGRPYRMRRPWAGQRSHLLAFADDMGRAGRAPLPLGALLTLRQWSSALACGGVEALAIEERLLGLAQSLMPDSQHFDARSRRIVEAAREYLASAPQRNDDLAAIAGAVHCSPFHLARQFRRQTGESLHGRRTRLRMALALHHLQQGADDLVALALSLGYASHSHFSAVFRRCFACTPGQMRRNLTAPVQP
jgi:AraC-like DNA-binding protein